MSSWPEVAIANAFLACLYDGSIPDLPEQVAEAELADQMIPGGFSNPDEEQLIMEVKTWVEKNGLPGGESLYELLDPVGENPVAVLDLAWPDGLQIGLSEPVALLIDEAERTMEIANQCGFKCFTDADSFKTYVQSVSLAA